MRLVVKDIAESPMGYHELRCTIKGFEKFEDGWDELAASDFAARLNKYPAHAELGHPYKKDNEQMAEYLERFLLVEEKNICLRIDEIYPEHDLVVVKVWFTGPLAEAAKAMKFDLGSRYTVSHVDRHNHVVFDVIQKEPI